MRRITRTIALLALLLCSSNLAPSHAQSDGSVPVYARQRSDARGGGVWRGAYRPPPRPPFDGAGQNTGFGYPAYGAGNGFFPYQPTIAGSWYSRPYPYHFDYYRQRYSAPVQTPIQDCPCANEVAPE